MSECFVICSAEPLDELADMVSTLFSPIKNQGQDPLPVIHDHPFSQNEMGVSSCFMLGDMNADFSRLWFPFKQSRPSMLLRFHSLWHGNGRSGGTSPHTLFHISLATRVLARSFRTLKTRVG